MEVGHSLFILLVAQQIWIFLSARRCSNREELFKIITENAADMIALVNVKDRRLYDRPSYQNVLGNAAVELARTPVFEQIHPDDRGKVLEASRLRSRNRRRADSAIPTAPQGRFLAHPNGKSTFSPRALRRPPSAKA